VVSVQGNAVYGCEAGERAAFAELPHSNRR
jgi:hypothetical protein